MTQRRLQCFEASSVRLSTITRRTSSHFNILLLMALLNFVMSGSLEKHTSLSGSLHIQSCDGKPKID